MDNKTKISKKKMGKIEKLSKLRQLLESYKKVDKEPAMTDLAKFLCCTRQTLYQDEDYQKILKEFEVGKKNKKPVIASEEYLLRRIDELNGVIDSKENKISKLHTKIAELEATIRENDTEIAKERMLTLRIQTYYLNLLEVYNKIANEPVALEPHDIHNLKKDPLKIVK